MELLTPWKSWSRKLEGQGEVDAKLKPFFTTKLLVIK